jgi:hypothetical protein
MALEKAYDCPRKAMAKIVNIFLDVRMAYISIGVIFRKAKLALKTSNLPLPL